MKYTIMIALFALTAPLASAPSAAPAGRTSDLSFVTAPPLLSCKADKVDLGRWDEGFAFGDEDIFILHKGEDFYLLPLIGPPKPTRICSVPGTRELRITCGVTYNKRLWLFCQPSTATDGVPCAIDARAGLKIDFDIPGADGSVTGGAAIQSWTFAPHAGGATFMVAGGPEKIWPRDGNRPLFFWFDLLSGRIRQLPVGWDLDFFSADQATAVFATTTHQPDGRRTLAGVSMKTGQDTPNIPDRARDHWIPWAWTNTDRVQHVAAPRKPGEGDSAYLAGLSFDGAWYPLSLPALDTRDCAFASLSERNGRVVFRACLPGNVPARPAPGWTTLVRNNRATLELDSKASDCALTGAQTGVFAAAGYGSKGDSTEAFCFNAETRRAWNLLDGIERLPALSPDDAGRDYIDDRMSVQLLRGTGDRRHPGLVLCLYSHGQRDNRADFLVPGETRVHNRQWRHSVLVASDKRYETGLFQEGIAPQFRWLLNSGKLVFGDREAPAESPGNAGAIRLSVVDLGSGPRS